MIITDFTDGNNHPSLHRLKVMLVSALNTSIYDGDFTWVYISNLLGKMLPAIEAQQSGTEFYTNLTISRAPVHAGPLNRMISSALTVSASADDDHRQALTNTCNDVRAAIAPMLLGLL